VVTGFGFEIASSLECTATQAGNGVSAIVHGVDNSTPAHNACDETPGNIGKVLFVAGGLLALTSIVELFRSSAATTRIRELQDANWALGVQMVPWYDPSSRSEGVLARVEF
jgi:hypothetical protein